MDKKTKTQFENLFAILNSSDIFTISSSVRYQRLLSFFNTFRTLRTEILKYPTVCKSAGLKWQQFHEELCDVESHGETINTFLSKTLSFDDAFINYSIFIIESVLEWNMYDDVLYEKLSKEVDQFQLIKTLRENCDNVPTKVCYKYLTVRVLPAIFSTHTSETERRELCELVLALPLGFAFEFMTFEVQRKFKEDALNKYIPYLWTNCFNKDWRQMCKVLIHYSGKLLHVENHLTNAILKIVESAFKKSTVEDRCAAYECWKLLIDNYSLDKKYLMHTKQVTLLLKPLKAKISRNRIVAIKKFDTYLHLMQQMDFAKDHMEKFLTYAFGPFEEEICDFIIGESVYNFRDLNTTCPKSTEILLKILEHDKLVCSCFNKTLPITNIFDVKISTIKDELYNWEVLVSCVRLCSQVNFNWLSADNRETVVTCLWSSLFKLSQHEKYKSTSTQNMKSIQLAIAKILNCSYMNKTYYDTFFKYILKSLVIYMDDVGFNSEVYNELVVPTIKELVIFQNNYPEKLPSYVYEDAVVELILYSRNDQSFFHTINIILDSEVYKCQLASDILSFALDHFAKTVPRDGKEANEILNILIRNIIIINGNANITAPDFSRDIDIVVRKNTTMLSELFETLLNSSQLIGVYKIASTLIRNTLLPKSITSQPFYNHLLDVIAKCITQISSHKTIDVAQMKETSVPLEKSLQYIVKMRGQNSKLNIESQKLFKIYTGLLQFEVYSVLDSLATLLEWTVKKEVPTELYNLISSLTDKEEISQKAFIVFAKIHSTGAKVKILSNTLIPVSPKFDNSVRLFGKFFDSPSPNKLRGSVLERTKSQLRNSKSSKDSSPRTSTPVKNIDEYSENAFTVSDKEVVLNIHKFSDHQKEIASKRREDIPALYSDLTQSQSQHTLDTADAAKEKVDVSPKHLLQNLNGNDNFKDNTKDKTYKQDTTNKNNTNTKDNGDVSPKEIENIKPNHEDSSSSTSKSRRDGSPSVQTKNNESVNNETSNDESGDKTVKTAKELIKLKMDLVGGNNMINLPRARSRRSRFFDDSIDPDCLVLPRLRRSKIDKGMKESTTSSSTNCDSDGVNTENVDQKNDDDEVPQRKEDEMEKPPIQNSGSESENIIPATQDVEVRVNLFRLPALSPTRKELDEAKGKIDIRKSKVITKIDFSALADAEPSKDDNTKTNNNDGINIAKKHSPKSNPKASTSNKTSPKPGTNETDTVVVRKRGRRKTISVSPVKPVDETLTLDMAVDSEADNCNIAEMDTESFISNNSLHLAQETPTKSNLTDLTANESLIGSPITPDTPSRTKELLDSTLDISPIQNKKLAGNVLPNLFVDLKSNEVSEQSEDVKVDFKSEEIATLKNPSTRSAKLLNLIGQSPKITTARSVIENSKTSHISSPKTDRVKKMMLSCAEDKGEDKEEKNEGQPLDKMYPNNDILEFNRVVPSPLALPRTSILKRKMSEIIDEGSSSPCPKRKRVNFPDPPTTCEKVYFKVDEEKQTFYRKRRSITKLLNEGIVTDQDKNNDASNAIKSMQNQIDELDEFDGVAPLETSPVRATNGRESPILSNPAPELLASCSTDNGIDLFSDVAASSASTSQHDKSKQIQYEGQLKVFEAMLEMAKDFLTPEDYINMCLDKMPHGNVEKWLNKRKLEQRKSKRKRTRSKVGM